MVTAKYNAFVRDRFSWLKVPDPWIDIRKYVVANSSKKSGSIRSRFTQ